MTRNGLSQANIYAQLRALEGEADPPPAKERRNSKKSRAHRHEIFTSMVELTPTQRAKAICNLARLWEDGLVSPENFLLVVRDILGE